jgi:ssDNA-binding Zn-finger/Zn-ribbon topoisomerase 1
MTNDEGHTAMKPKTAIGIVLLVFAGGSLGYLAVTELMSGGGAGPPTAGGEGAAAADLPADGVVVTYFYGGTRCPTCRKIEAYAEEAVARGFPDAVAAGTVRWRTVDTDEAPNKHFVDRYDLFAKELIVSKRAGGEEVAWASLEEIWTRVDDKADFLAYVRGAVAEHLETP